MEPKLWVDGGNLVPSRILSIRYFSSEGFTLFNIYVYYFCLKNSKVKYHSQHFGIGVSYRDVNEIWVC